jgi:acyl carrier protein
MDIQRRVRDYIATRFYVAEPDRLSEEASLVEEGIIDSTGLLEVVAFIESTFEVTVGDEEMLPDNLDSIARITAFVRRKRGDQSPSESP